MTAWTAVVVPLFIIAKSSIDFLVLEYGSKFQVMNDDTFVSLTVCCCTVAVLVDMMNIIFRVREGRK